MPARSTDKPELGRIGILVLIHHDITETLLVRLQHLRHLSEQFHRFHDQIVKIQGIVAVLTRFWYSCVEPLPSSSGKISLYTHGSKSSGVDQLILCGRNLPPASPVPYKALYQCSASCTRLLHHSFLIFRIVNDKVCSHSPDLVNIAPQNPHTGGMERGNPNALRTKFHRSLSTRSRISPAALLVKVIAKIFQGLTSFFFNQIGRPVCQALWSFQILHQPKSKAVPLYAKHRFPLFCI